MNHRRPILASYAELQDAATARYTLLRHRRHRAHLVAQVHAASGALRLAAAASENFGKAYAAASVEFAHPVQNPVENHSGVIQL